MTYTIKEVYDGRLPEYQVIYNNEIIRTFEEYDDAVKWVSSKETTACGEENPCE